MPPACDPSNQRGSACLAATVIAVAAVVQTVVVLHADPLQSANDRSRWCTIRALCEEGSYRIDRVRQLPGWDTIDLVRVDGHFYSTKPPLMATWVAGVVAGIQAVTGWTFDRDLKAINAATLLIINGLPFVLWLIALAVRLPALTSNRATAGFVLMTAAWGTLLSPFLASLNNHTVAAMGIALAAWIWLRPRCSGPLSPVFGGEGRGEGASAPQSIRSPTEARTLLGASEDPLTLTLSPEAGARGPNKEPRSLPLRQIGWFALWGAAAGWAVCHDLPSGLFAAVMLWEAWRQSRTATLFGFLPGAALPVIAFFVCNVVATGSWVPAYAGYGGESYRFIHEGVPSYWLDPQGVDRNLDAPAAYLFHCLVGHHGWFSLTPLWLIVVAALPFAKPGESALQRRGLWWTVGLTAGVVGFYLTRTQNYNYGGVSCGLRWAVFLTPLWVISLAIALDRFAARPKLIATAALVTLAVSVYSEWEPLGRPWQQPWLFRLGEQRGWFNYQAPIPPLPRPLHGWIAELPATDAAAWIEYRRSDVQGITETLRLTQQPGETVAGRALAVIAVERRHGTNIVEQRTLRIDRQKFAAGQPPAECLVWTAAGVTAADQQADLAFYRGLPLHRPYHPGVIRYLKTVLRTDALVCQRSAAQVDYGLKDAPPLRYRCDLWRTDELPFGTARVEWTVTDPVSGAVLQREAWEAAACHPPVSPQSPLTIDSFRLPR